jgi:hypothetical protein
MDIVLDSNIYRNDLLLRSNSFDLALDYLKRTKSSFILPEIIFKETSELYRRDLTARKLKLETSSKDFNLLMINAEKYYRCPAVDVNEAVSDYEIYLKQRLKIKSEHILPINDDFFREVIDRCIERHKPAGEKFQARDVLIWLTIKAYCQKTSQRQIAFISGNYKDFAGENPNQLDERLSEECNRLNIKIHYFQSMNDFLVKQSKDIEFINEDFIADNTDFASISEFLLDNLQYLDSDIIQSWFPEEQIIGKPVYRIIDLFAYDHERLFVYEMLDGRYIANVETKIQLEIQLNNYKLDTSSGAHIFSGRSWKVVCVSLQIALTIIDGQVIDRSLTSFEVLD